MSGLEAEELRARYGDFELELASDPTIDAELRLTVPAAQVRKLLARLRDDEASAMTQLVDLTALDRSGHGGGLEVVYRLRSLDGNRKLRVHARLDEPSLGREPGTGEAERPGVDSVCGLWPSASWLEREVFDLFGIRFRGHPDLRRIMLEEGFEGAPLRKAHPLRLDRPLPAEAME